MKALPDWLKWGLAGLLLAGAYWFGVAHVSPAKRQEVATGTLVKLPLFVEVALAGGDRYLAANIGAVRAMVASVEEHENGEAGLRVLAEIEKDVSRLNPGHEDNYYLAAAALIGTPQHDDGQWVLRRAIDARPFDFIPPFFYAVHRMHYDKDPADGAQWMRLAAARSADENNRIALEKTAARWILKGADPAMAAALLDLMAKQARHGSLRDYIAKRAEQARQLLALRQAVGRFAERFGRAPASLEELAGRGILPELPQDPLGVGYELDAQGVPAVRRPQPKGRKP